MTDCFPWFFSPYEKYGFSQPMDDWNFHEREAEMDREFDQGLEYKSKLTLNLSKQHPK